MPAADLQLPVLHVAAGVLQNEAGQVLIAQRPAGSHMAGAWEFPGGKIAAGESYVQGLVRELDEELGIQAGYVRHLARLTHDYPDRRVHLYVWKVVVWSGEPRGAEGQALQWLQPDELLQAGLLPADAGVVTILSADAAVNKASWRGSAQAILG
jgi:8-oxo-dGTP diphosphatase